MKKQVIQQLVIIGLTILASNICIYCQDEKVTKSEVNDPVSTDQKSNEVTGTTTTTEQNTPTTNVDVIDLSQPQTNKESESEPTKVETTVPEKEQQTEVTQEQTQKTEDQSTQQPKQTYQDIIYQNLSIITVGQFVPVKINAKCGALIFNNYYRRLELTMKFKGEDGQFLLTDKLNRELTQKYDSLQCPQGSKICTISKNNDELTRFDIGICTESVVVYACSEDEEEFEIEYKAELSNLPCSQSSETEYTKCAQFNKEQCTQKELCTTDCKWLECIANSQNQLSLCIPSQLSNEHAFERCKSVKGYVDNSESQQPNVTVCPYTSFLPEQAQSMGWFTIAIIIIIAIILFCFVFSVIYYRYKVNRDNMVPFNPPSFCPDFIFPKVYDSAEIHGIEQTEYHKIQ